MARGITLPYSPHTPTRKQLAFLLLPHQEAMYGGAAGGGKSDALLMAALQYADVPGYASLLFRRTYQDLALPGALMDRAKEWLRPTDAKWDDINKTWHFPSGASLTFGYLEHEDDRFRYQSAEFQMIGFDELTQFSESQYRYLFSRLRRLVGSPIPLRMRVASNPGGVGHDWVKRRFIDEGRAYGRVFIPANLDDNPFLDHLSYIKSMDELDPITRQQLLHGDWTARHGGSTFRREWFGVVDTVPADCVKVRYWDLAATEPKRGADPDWTAGVMMGKGANNALYILDVRRLRGSPQVVEHLIRQTAEMDGRYIPIRIEEEPGASGKSMIDYYMRQVLMGWNFQGVRTTGDKVVRANPVSSQAEAGNVKILHGGWNGAFLDEMEAFPQGGHDDQVDAVSGAFEYLVPRGGRKIPLHI